MTGHACIQTTLKVSTLQLSVTDGRCHETVKESVPTILIEGVCGEFRIAE